jgi:uncharacterized membrane-anchored protein YhcB (DUF1043 family)
MRMMRWMRAGVVAGVAAMLVAASAGAQTVPEDAARMAAQQADVQAQVAKVQAQVAAQQAQMAPLQAKLAEQMAQQQAQMGPILAKLAVQMQQLEPLQAELQAQMAPMMAKMEVSMAPMEAEMMARSAALQAQMLARGVVMQDGGMVSIGDPQVKDDLFDGTEKFAKGASDVTSVNLGPDMLGMVSGKHGGDMAHKLNFMVVRTYEYPRPGMYNLADVDVYRQKLKAGNWNCFIHTEESKTGESTDICNRALPNGEGNEMVILTVEPKELTFIHMSGKGSLADLGKMGAMGHMHMGNMNMQEAPEPPPPPDPPTPPSPHP